MSSSDDEASKIATACGLALYEFDSVPVIGHVLTVPGVHFHAALGHPSPAIMKGLEFPSGPTLVECSCCASGKVTRVLSKQVSSPKSKAPLRLIHADVSGPVSIPGFAAEKYFLAIVDDFFRWSQVIPMNMKSQQMHMFRILFLLLKTTSAPVD